MRWSLTLPASLTGNDLFRSTFASVFPLFGAAFFHHLGLGGASTLLAALSTLMIPLLYVTHNESHELRVSILD